MSVVKNKETGKYDVRYYYRNEKGELVPTTKRGFVNELKAKEFDETMKINTKNEIDVAHLKFEEFVNIYLEYVKVDKKFDTYYTYKNRLEVYIIPFFKKYKLLDISSHIFRQYKIQLSKMKTKKGDLLKDKNKNGMIYTLKAMFTYAKNEFFYKVPCYDFMKPFEDRDINEPVNILDKHEVLELVNYIDDKEIYLKGLILLFFFTGCRSSEGRGLQWKYVDFRRNTIRVEKIIKMKGNKKGVKYRFEVPKNKNSKKILPMYKELRDMLYKIYLRDSVRKDFNLDKLVFGYDIPIAETTLRRKLKEYSKEIDLPYVTPHGFKHSCVTYLASVGVPINDIANYVGETIEVLMKVYVHAFVGYKQRVLISFD